jgi:beta-lactamase superfamily II metal-dependent hydrolase
VACAAAASLAAWTVFPGLAPAGPEITVLDVGQGDAVLLRDGSAVVLVDGGPEPGVLARALARRRIRRIDLLVVTHEHADHTTGLVGITARVDVRRAWVAPYAEESGPLGEVMAELTAAGVAVARPVAGWSAAVGGFRLEVLGPLRRYAGPNDGSLVLLAEASGVRALLAGDVERIAQEEIGVVRAEILKVPHQGAATSDPEWLRSVGASVALISVGPNDYGHPDPAVISILEAAGTQVLRTDRGGDLTVAFSDPSVARRQVAVRRYGGGDEADPRRGGPPGRRSRGAYGDAAAGPCPPRSGRRRRVRPRRRASQGWRRGRRGFHARGGGGHGAGPPERIAVRGPPGPAGRGRPPSAQGGGRGGGRAPRERRR